MLNNVSKDEKPHSRSDQGETTIESVNEIEALPMDEAASAEQKQQTSESSKDRWSPRDISVGSFG
jgi:hypothetical protein